MIQVRRSNERGYADHGWLKSFHTFSFADYYDPEHMGFRSLRVINEDRIAGGTGFGSHPHRDMEIISYVVQGGLRHKDSMGKEAIIKPGEVQKMSAGTGVVHSEYNHLEQEETHFFQIWIQPALRGGAPSYGQKSFQDHLDSQDIVHVISPDGQDGTLAIGQDAHMHISRLPSQKSLTYELNPGRGLWVQVVKGKVAAGEHTLTAGDGFSVEELPSVSVQAQADSELLLFDLA